MWLIGAGWMAKEYTKTLRQLSIQPTVIGRGLITAADFESQMNMPVFTGGIDSAIQELGCPRQAIVAVGVEQLEVVAESLIYAGCKAILLEKPGALDLAGLIRLERMADEYGANVSVAFNRRFYPSVAAAKEVILRDGGISSVSFEFTEWASHVSDNSKFSPRVKASWVMANSSHVIDLVFHLCGRPAEYACYRRGSLDWHPSGSRFVGAGVTDQNVCFSYSADWAAPGRWGVELMTPKSRLILRPMEQLKVIPLNQLDAIDMVLESNEFERNLKPGLLNMVSAFIAGETVILPSIAEHRQNTAIFAEMGGYL